MSKEMLSKAGDAAKALLSTMLGENAPLKFGSLKPVDLDEVRDDVLSLLGIYPSDFSFAVVLDPGWLPLVAGLKLGVQTRVGDEDYEAIVQELAGLFVSAVQTHFSTLGSDMDASSLQIKEPGQGLDDAVYDSVQNRLPFFMEWDDAILHGSVLVGPMDTEELAQTAETQNEPTEVVVPDTPEFHSSEPGQGAGNVKVRSAAFPDLGAESIGDPGNGSLGLLADVELEVTVELGRRRMPLSDVLRLTTGSVLELEKLVGEPLQIFANNRFIAEGEAVVIEEQFGVRITALASRAAERILR